MPKTVFTLRWVGIPEAIIGFEKELRAIARESATVVRNTAALVAKKAATSLRRGQFKAYRTGALSRAHTHEMVKNDDKGSQANVSNILRYAYFIHGGTRKMSGRPWLRHTVNKEITPFTRKLRKVVERKKDVQIVSQPSLSFNSPR